MQSQTLISILVWVAVFGFTRGASDELNDLQKTELANKLNALVQHSGWRFMGNVKTVIIKNRRRKITDPMSEILGAIRSDRNPVDESNAIERYTDIWNVLRCRYAEVIIKYRIFLQHLIRVCRTETRTTYSSLQKYYDCFDLVLIKLYSVSARFKSMSDAMDFVYSIGHQWKPKKSIMIAVDKLTEFTENIRPKVLSKLSERGINEEFVDDELKSISKYIGEVFNNNVNWFVSRYCIIPLHREWTPENLNEDYEYKKSIHRIPQETTVLEYVERELDSYVDDILGSWFSDLGFAYDETGNVTIGIN